MKLIDIHAHLNFPDYDTDREQVIERTVEAGCGVVNVGTNIQTSREVVELTKYPNFWATVGVHPHEAGGAVDWGELERLARHERVVAIGECGLDYFRLVGDEAMVKKSQRELFEKQIDLALKVNKPLMLHVREAYDEVLAILKHFPGARGNAHFFAGSLSQAGKFLDLGFTLSFTGVITFVPDYNELVRFMPLDRLLAETDAPFVAPIPHRGKRNEPLYVAEVMRAVAVIKGLELAEVERQVLATAVARLGTI